MSEENTPKPTGPEQPKPEKPESTPAPDPKAEKPVAEKPATGDKPTPPAKPAAKPVAKKPQPKKDPRDKLFRPERMLVLSSSPHFHTADSVPTIMWNVVGALAPAAIMAVIYFGWFAVGMISVCVAAALLTEFVANRMRGEANTLGDGSAAITGLLLALTLPPSLPLWAGALGSIFAIAIGKHLFGGLGYNIFNPALLGRAFLQASFPVAMTTWTWPGTSRFADVDGITAATPLGLFKFERVGTELVHLLTGNIGGSLGETSALAVLAGGLYLLIRKYAEWRIPVSFLGSVFLFGGLFWLIDPARYPDPVFQLFAGGLMLGAFFMATDMVTSPITVKGQVIFAVGCGVLTALIRLFGGFPEGVCFSILLMNTAVPLIDRYTQPRVFGAI